MNQLQPSKTPTRALADKPALAVTSIAEPTARTPAPATDAAREARIREAAYALYETRGRVDGHDLDDWLAAEAALTGEVSGSEAAATATVAH